MFTTALKTWKRIVKAAFSHLSLFQNDHKRTLFKQKTIFHPNENAAISTGGNYS